MTAALTVGLGKYNIRTAGPPKPEPSLGENLDIKLKTHRDNSAKFAPMAHPPPVLILLLLYIIYIYKSSLERGSGVLEANLGVSIAIIILEISGQGAWPPRSNVSGVA